MEINNLSSITNGNKNEISFEISQSDFIENIFEKNIHLFTKAFNPACYDWNEVSKDFYGINPIGTEVRIFQENLKDKNEYLTGHQQSDNIIYEYKTNKIKKYLDEGATIVINNYDRHSFFAAKLRNEISHYVNEKIVGNAYISKGKSKTFGLHFDRHCVFIAQIIGKKRWRIFKPTFELPMNHQRSLEYKESHPPSELAFDGILNAGDIFYIPRGWWHETSTLSDSPSFHITYGAHTNRNYDFMRWVLQNKMPQNIEFRKSILNSEINHTKKLESALIEYKKLFLSKEIMDEYFHLKRSEIESQKLINFKYIMDINHE